jgi:hypothetical protein
MENLLADISLLERFTGDTLQKRKVTAMHSINPTEDWLLYPNIKYHIRTPENNYA